MRRDAPADGTWREERRRLQRRLVDAEFNRLAANARAAKAERILVETQARAVQLEHDLIARDAEVAALRTSTSWRLTRPIRGVSRLLGAR